MQFFFTVMADLKHDANDHGIIPWTAIHQYANAYGLDVEMFERTVAAIRAMEEGIEEERQKEKKAQEASAEQKKTLKK